MTIPSKLFAICYLLLYLKFQGVFLKVPFEIVELSDQLKYYCVSLCFVISHIRSSSKFHKNLILCESFLSSTFNVEITENNCLIHLRIIFPSAGFLPAFSCLMFLNWTISCRDEQFYCIVVHQIF